MILDFVLFFLFSWLERIFVPELHGCQSVVDQSVMRFIRSDGQDDFSHLGIGWQLPVLDGDVWSWQILPHGQPATVQLLQDVSVGDDSFFLKVSNKSAKENHALI